MSDSYIFSPTGTGGLPTYDELQRRRTAMAQIMARRSPAPKNIGEGLNAIGEAIGDRRYMDSVRADEAAQAGYQQKVLGDIAGDQPITRTPYSPTGAAPAAPGPVSDAAPAVDNETVARWSSRIS
jgi:hypothetical protein